MIFPEIKQNQEEIKQRNELLQNCSNYDEYLQQCSDEEQEEFEKGLDRAKEYGLDAEYLDCIARGMSPAEALREWDLLFNYNPFFYLSKNSVKWKHLKKD